MLLDACASMLAVGTLFYLLLLYVFSPARTNWHRLVGAVVAYLLIAIIWARAFQILLFFNPQALDLPSPEGNLSDLIYFSFATLTTLGYGLPKGPIARSLTEVEAIAGQMFLAILVARLVSAPAPKPTTGHTE
jgi:Ion channel